MRPPVGNAEQSAATQAEDEFEVLIGRAGSALNRQCRAARQELKQTRQLLADASRQLLDAFHAATCELAAMQMPTGEGPGANSAAVPHPASGVSQRLLAASQHLQFSDLVGQLLASMEHRVDGMLRLSQELRALVQVLEAARDDPAGGGTDVEHGKRALMDAVVPLESGGESRVRQADLKAGEVDLF
jgi:hypothetical protein